MRVISLAPSNTEILCALGLAHDIIATTIYCDYPKSMVKKPKVGSWIAIKQDYVASLKPDLIVTATVVQEKIAERLQQSKLPVLHLDPRTIDGIYRSILAIGQATGTEAKATQLIASMKDELENHKNKLPKRQRVYIEEWHRPPFASGNWVPELVFYAGGQYGLVSPGILSRTVTTKEVQQYDPQVIFLSICGFHDKLPTDIVRRRKGWENLSAVKHNQVYVLDDTVLNRPGPRIVNAVSTLRQYL